MHFSITDDVLQVVTDGPPRARPGSRRPSPDILSGGFVSPIWHGEPGEGTGALRNDRLIRSRGSDQNPSQTSAVTALPLWAVPVASCRPSRFRAHPFQWGRPGGRQAQLQPRTLWLAAALLPAQVHDHGLGLGTPAPPALDSPPALWPRGLPPWPRSGALAGQNAGRGRQATRWSVSPWTAVSGGRAVPVQGDEPACFRCGGTSEEGTRPSGSGVLRGDHFASQGTSDNVRRDIWLGQPGLRVLLAPGVLTVP